MIEILGVFIDGFDDVIFMLIISDIFKIVIEYFFEFIEAYDLMFMMWLIYTSCTT